MPYYVFKYEDSELARLKPFELLEEFTAFKDASKFAKATRAALIEDESYIIKVIFADNSQQAEELLREKREPQPSDD